MRHRLRDDAPLQIFHITARVNWRAWHLATDHAKRLLAELIQRATRSYGVRLFAWVLMSNHFHLVSQSPPDAVFHALTGRRTGCRHFRAWPAGHPNAAVMSRFMRTIRQGMTNIWRKELELEGRFWDGPYDARPVHSIASLVARIAYDHCNPVKAGMVAAPEDYPWSSAGEWTTGEPGEIPVCLCGDPLFGVSFEELRERIYSQLGEDNGMQRYIEELRKSTYVDIRIPS